MEAISDDRVRALMGETGWLRRLAQSMVKDPDAADDLAQDAWIIATQKAPTDGRPLRPWLARVLLNLVRMRSRGDKRRTAREERSGEAERGEATPEQLYERVEMQRMLADAVLALSPIYRDVVLLHYVDGLTSIEIGARFGISEGTVRWRLKAAISQMREALDQKQKGNRALWLAPMLRFARPDSPAVKSGAGFAAAILLAALLVGGIAALLGTRGESSTTSPTTPSAATSMTALSAHAPSSPASTSSIPAWAVQPGVPAKRIAGVVRSRGAVVAGASVVLHVQQHMTNHSAAPIAIAHSGPDGTFDLGVQPVTDYWLGASSPGLTPQVIWVRLAEPAPRMPHDKLVLDLEACTARVVGTVSDSSGGPIAHASLRMDKLLGTESDARGHYELCLRTMPNWLVIGADGYASTSVMLRWLGGTVERDITLVPEGTLVGTVVTTDGAPVPGARVEAFPMLYNESVGDTVFADENGRFEVPKLASGQYRLNVDAQGLRGFSQPIDVHAGARTLPQTIIVSRAVQVHARVIVDGAPAAGARVLLGDDVQVLAYASVQTDGSVVFSNVPVGHVKVMAEQYRVVSSESVEIHAQMAPLVIALAHQPSIVGRVLHDGAPVTDAMVSCSPLARDTRVLVDGSFVLEGLDGPSCQLLGYSLTTGWTSSLTPVTLNPGEQKTIDLALTNDASIEGIVVDEHGAPVAGADVRFFGDTDGGAKITEPDGRFLMTNLVGGMELRPLVFPSPFDSAAFEWAEPQPVVRLTDGHSKATNVRLAIRNTRGSIRGIIVDDRQQPVSDATVTAYGPHDTSDNTTRLARSGVDGRFEIAALAPGKFRVQANGADSSIAMQLDVATGADITLVLPRSGRIEGTVVGFTDTPFVTAQDHERGIGIGAFVTADHRFRTLGLTPGTYLLSANGGGSALQRVTVRSGEVAHADLVSSGTARIEITLLRHRARTPIADAPCVATGSAFGYPAWWSGPQVRTDAQGRAVITDGPAGHVRVQCWINGGSPAASEVDVVANGVVPITLTSVETLPKQVDPGFDLQPFEMPARVWHVRGKHAAALAPGDVVLAVDGEDISAMSPLAVIWLILSHEPGSQILVRFQRGDTVSTVAITLRRQTDQ